MMGSGNVPAADDHTAREEAEGKAVWERLQVKETTCTELAAEDYEALGEYFMGRMLGSSHAIMNQMMMQRMGEEGEEQMHEVMGRRMSGCDVAAAFPAAGADFTPMMMNMMGGGGAWQKYPAPSSNQAGEGSVPWKDNNNLFNSIMGGFGYPMGFGGGLFMVLWWILIIVALVTLVRWLVGQVKSGERGRAAEILKERYAKGEIDKKEFEDMKKTLGA
jgi:putative membrane protein